MAVVREASDPRNAPESMRVQGQSKSANSHSEASMELFMTGRLSFSLASYSIVSWRDTSLAFGKDVRIL
jgi:hypothetical protein